MYHVIVQVPDGDALVNSTKSFKDHHSAIFHKVIKTSHQKEVVDEHVLTIPQLTLSSIKVKVNIQVLNEGGDWVSVSVGLFLDNLD